MEKKREKVLNHPIDSKFTYERFMFEPSKIQKITVESPNVKSFYLKVHSVEPPLPGQFLMVWLPGAEEVPMSVSDAGGKHVRITVAKTGPTTEQINKLEEKGTIFVRGPFGSSFKLDANSYLLVGGGYGAAPLIYASKVLSRAGKKGVYAVGAENSSELLFTREARKHGLEVCAATEDGSSGHRGLVTDILNDLSKRFKFDSILTCGPERMMYKVLKRGLKLGIPVQASLERYMKCGFGVCGSCVLDPIGARVCVDGPVFDGKLLLKTDFGKWKRDPSGMKVRV